MSSIFWRTVRQVSLSGRPCLTSPKPISSRFATSPGPASPLPLASSPALVASCVAIGPESTHCGRDSISLTPDWGALVRRPGGAFTRLSLNARVTRAAPRAAAYAVATAPTAASTRSPTPAPVPLELARRSTHRKLRLGQGGSGVSCGSRRSSAEVEAERAGKRPVSLPPVRGARGAGPSAQVRVKRRGKRTVSLSPARRAGVWRSPAARGSTRKPRPRGGRPRRTAGRRRRWWERRGRRARRPPASLLGGCP